MQKRTQKVALLAVLALALVVCLSAAALAGSSWRDLPDSVSAKYGITDNQIAGISEGYASGVWKPFQSVTRAQFTKMAVAAFNIPLERPAIASYKDVSPSDQYYPYIEAAKASGIVSGTSTTTFSPDVKITRQQAIAIVSRYIAKVQGFDLATMYTATDITHILSHFADASTISSDLRDEAAFAFDMGITAGDDYGRLNPLSNLMRIQGAALLIRAQSLVPPKLWAPAKLEMTSADKTEGLIGQNYMATFKVTTADGHPAKGVLVDFDTIMANDFYVGQVSPEAKVTDNNGEVTVTLISAEPGTMRVSASVQGVGTIYLTRYWLAIDEVYTTGTTTARNNAGVEHTWQVRVVVFGPGPRSTSQDDWYNAIDASFDPANINVDDGVDYSHADGWTIDTETAMKTYKTNVALTPRTLAGIDVEWTIYNAADDPDTTKFNDPVTSVGNIVKVNGASISPAKYAVGKTDASGLSSIAIVSQAIGRTFTKAVADYEGNPYPEQLFNHATFNDYEGHYLDWDDQPAAAATQVKTWIAHTMGVEPGPIDPSYQAANIGEEPTLTLTLLDTYGNPVPGRSVEWTMQGVGFFQTDDAGDSSDIYKAANNKDFDTTNAAGEATLFVKSYEAGEQIIHAKVRDKGTSGAEGTYTTYTAEVQWFDADAVTFDDITTTGTYVADPATGLLTKWDEQNEALSTNPVNTPHQFCLHVYGLKLEYDPTLEDPDHQTPIIDSDAAGNSYDFIFDSKDADYFGGILLVNPNDLKALVPGSWTGGNVTSINVVSWGTGYTGPPTVQIAAPSEPGGVMATAHAVVLGGSVIEIVVDNPGSGYTVPPAVTIVGGGYVTQASALAVVSELVVTDETMAIRSGITLNSGGKITANLDPETVTVAGRTIKLSYVGGYTKYDFDDDGYKEDFPGVTGIYLPLAGKSVRFSAANSKGNDLSNSGVYFDGASMAGVGPKTGGSLVPMAPASVATDAAGTACVTANSGVKGPETIKAVVDWPGNPHNGAALAKAYAKRLWVAGTIASAGDLTIQIYINDVLIATNKDGVLKDGATGDPLCGHTSAYVEGKAGVLNNARVWVRVLDVYGNDLPDYEVVYLLEGIDSWLEGTQEAADTFVPWAYLVDMYDNYDDKLVTNYDQNGNRPDSDEPLSSNDPYGRIVGAGGTQAFFFNQWLGSEKPVDGGHAGLESWWTRIPGMGFLGYHEDKQTVSYHYQWPRDYYGSDALFDGFDGVIDGVYTDPYNYPDWPKSPSYHVGLATDGAKAWTLDGYFNANQKGGVDIQPNLLTGSMVDIQLADAFAPQYATLGYHLKSILRVMVYSPADGVVKEGLPIWSIQVHNVWEMPVPTTIEIDPVLDWPAADDNERTQLAVTVKDQFGNAMPDVEVRLTSKILEGTVGATWNDTLVGMTDSYGNLAVSTGTKPRGAWGVEEVTAKVADGSDAGLTSVPTTIQWIYYDNGSLLSERLMWTDANSVVHPFGPDLVTTTAGQSRVLVDANFTPWGGKTIRIYTNAALSTTNNTWVGSGTYVVGSGANINTSVATWTVGSRVYLQANSGNTDGVPNWILDLVVP